MNHLLWEHGFRRLTAIVSLIGSIFFLILMIVVIVDEYINLHSLDPVLFLIFPGFILIAAISPWFLFYLIRFVVRGFLPSGIEK